MPAAAFLLALAASGHGLFDGRLPSHGQVQTAFATSRACVEGAAPCPRTTIVTSDENCYRIEVPRARLDHGAVAGARCRFRYGESAGPDAGWPSRWTRTHADFFLTGTPCGPEGQESDMMCYSWVTERPADASGAGAEPTAAEVEAALPAGESVCLDGTDRRTGRPAAICSVLSPHVQRIACHSETDLGGYVCDYAVHYADYRHGIGGANYELRSDLFARGAQSPHAWQLVREIAPPRTEPR